MISLRIACLGLTLLALSLPAATASAQHEPLIVEIQLKQGTDAGPPPPAGLTVQLVMMTEHAPLRTAFAAVADNDAVARIEVDRAALGQAIVRTLAVATYNDIRFYSEPLMLTAATPSPARALLILHETSDDAAPLEVVRQTISILGQQPDGLAMHEMTVIRNPTDRVIASRQMHAPLLTDTLPHGIFYEPQRSTSIVEYSDESNELFFYGPFMPGETQVVISYLLAATQWPVALRKPLAFVPPERMAVAVATRGFNLRGPLGRSQVNRDLMPPVPLLVHQVQPREIRPGDDLVIQITRHPVRALPRWSYVVVVAMAVLAMGLVLFRRSDRALTDESP